MTRWITRATNFSLAAILAGCQGVAQKEAVQLEGPTGSISGVVAFAGRHIPPATIIANEKDAQACGTKFAKLDVLVSHENYGLANVVVWLADVQLPDGYGPPRQDLRLAAQRCQFTPRMAAMTVGSTIQMKNTDPISHNADLSGAQDDKVHLEKPGDEFSTVARAAGLIKVRCADHEWMEAFVLVDPHPFHAVTNSEGEFRIEAVPVGTYRIQLWHEKFQRQEVEVVVRAGEITSLQLTHPAPNPLPYPH